MITNNRRFIRPLTHTAKGRTFAAILTLLAGLMPAGAEYISPEQALARLDAEPRLKKQAMRPSSMTLAHTAKSDDGAITAFYIFDKPAGGFTILSADDRLPAMIGDTDNGSFDIDRIPSNLRWWLSQYSDEITTYLAGEALKMTPARETRRGFVGVDRRHNVDQLLKTTWNQTDPFNRHCPDYGDERSVTGCVATAMAQVMKYHQWPERNGTGSESYTSGGLDISYDFSKADFDWSKMPDSYDGCTDTDKMDAVANLMLACGASVRMDYSPQESSASHTAAAAALKKYFGYDSSTTYIQRSLYTLRDWTDRIYREMEAGRPVIYGGAGSMGGHSFVCDGYATTGHFHINWGWGGAFDGYYLLSALNPEDVGVGGGAGEYNSDQDAIINIAPEIKGEKESDPLLYAFGRLNIHDGRYYDDCYKASMQFMDGGIYNPQLEEFDGEFGFELRNIYGELLGYYKSLDHIIPGYNPDIEYPISGIGGFNIQIPRNLEPDTYLIFPAAKRKDGEWMKVPVVNGDTQCVAFNIDEDGIMTFNYSITQFDEIEVTGMVISGDLYPGRTTQFDIYATNLGFEHYTVNVLLMVDVDGSETSIALFPIDAEGRDTQSYSFYGSIYLDPGVYSCRFRDEAGNLLSPDFTLTVLDPAGESGVDSITEGDETPAEYYRLDGIKAATPGKGIYIRSTDRKAIVR